MPQDTTSSASLHDYWFGHHAAAYMHASQENARQVHITAVCQHQAAYLFRSCIQHLDGLLLMSKRLPISTRHQHLQDYLTLLDTGSTYEDRPEGKKGSPDINIVTNTAAFSKLT